MPSRNTLTEKELTLIELLQKAGTTPGTAKVLAVMAKGEETVSVRIEGLTSLRQPEVSIVMRDLIRRKWIKRRDIKKEGKGRPVHGYTLAVQFSDIIKEMEAEQRKRIQEVEQTLARLKRLARGL
jgi:predicted transcriptional regulator